MAGNVMLPFLVCLCVGGNLISAAKLQVSGKDLVYDGQVVFLNGVNIAWNDYGNDFGNDAYDGTLELWLQDIAAAGGNSIRMWVHIEGDYTPIYDVNGFVTSCDTTSSFGSDISTFLDAALQNDILVTLVLFNGALMGQQNTIDLFWDDSKLDSYIENCLTSVVQLVSGHPALGSWEVINEPEGSVKVETNADPCYDTTIIGQSGAGWTGVAIPMQRILRTIGRLNQVFRLNDPTGLVTLGSWGQFAQSDAFSNTVNHYSDSCLEAAAGGVNASLDYYQMHTYDWGQEWSPNAPFTVHADDYSLGKPLILGEFSSDCGLAIPLNDMFEYAYNNGYNGAWSWHWTATGGCSDSQAIQSNALGQLQGRSENGLVDIDVN